MRREARTRDCFSFRLVGGWVSESDRTASYAARLRSRQVAGVGAGPESHGGGVNSFVRVGMGGDIVE